MPTKPAPPSRPAPPDLSKLPTIQVVQVQFQTNDDDKDGDTQLTVSFAHNGSVFASTPRTGDSWSGWMQVANYDFWDHGNTPWVTVPMQSTVRKDAIHQCSTTVAIDPNGNDTWRFNYWVKVQYSDGTTDEFHFDNHALSEKVRENTFTLK